MIYVVHAFHLNYSPKNRNSFQPATSQARCFMIRNLNSTSFPRVLYYDGQQIAMTAAGNVHEVISARNRTKQFTLGSHLIKITPQQCRDYYYSLIATEEDQAQGSSITCYKLWPGFTRAGKAFVHNPSITCSCGSLTQLMPHGPTETLKCGQYA